ncbi:MAG: SIMPL domain-containing protein [Armatimonadota bacterium]|nr:MAG: SIMPL domain-containing protein [Armatimonadota bacterium]
MRVWLAVIAGAVILALGGAASAEMVKGQATTIAHPTMTVTGSGTVEVAPDTLRVTASIITEGDTVEAARERNAQIVRAAMDAVKALNLANVMTKTLDYTLERVTQNASVRLKVDPSKWDIPWKITETDLADSSFHIDVPVTLGYRAANSLTVRIQGEREALSDGAGKIIDALMAAGTNQITSVAYTLEKDNSAAMRESLTKAVRDAQMTAEAVAAAAGRTIVGIRNISPSYRYPAMELRNVQASFRGGRYAEQATPTSVTAGMLEMTAQVNINYELDFNPGDTQFLPAPQ